MTTTVRDPDVGAPDLAALAEALPPRARVLDLGCGDGVPVSRLLLREGFGLTALDGSSGMGERYQALLEGAGMQLVRDYTDAWGNYVYVAAKAAGPATASRRHA
ncbi:MAG TPA: methyltransferase domain-containing protein [Rubricoccaceae bacterium]